MTSETQTTNYGVPTVNRLPKPPDVYIPGFCAKTNLPEELFHNPDVRAFLALGVTQWSRIAAWTWCKYLAFEHTPKLKDKEIELKKTLISLLTQQSSYADAYLNYGNRDAYDTQEGSKDTAKAKSQGIVNQLLDGDNLKSWYWKPTEKPTPIIEDWTEVASSDEICLDENIAKLTLSDVLIKTTATPLVTSIPENEAFVKLFYVQVTRDSFTGRIVRASDNPENPYTQYINIIAYPPRPETFIDLLEPGDKGYTDDFKDRDSLLTAWARGDNFPDLENDYLPPSAYIPIATT